jgi:uncharacterized protein (DUF1501 family)
MTMTQANFKPGAPAVLHHASRRLFLRQASTLSVLAGAGAPLALNLLATGSAAAQTAGDYRAVVCLFMFGGNDAFNMVLPTDAASWNAYAAMRGQSNSSIGLLRPGTAPNLSAPLGSPARLGEVLSITPTHPQGRAYALHPLLGSLQKIFNTDKRLAIVANVGPLVQPTTKVQYAQPSHPRPPRLFSHNDQQSIWQTMMPEGATVGWGGRMADMMLASNDKAVFTSVSAAGSAVWLSGSEVRQYQVSGAGPLRLGADSNNLVYGSSAVATALDRIARSVHGSHVLQADVAEVSQRSIDAEFTLRGALRPATDPAFGTAPASGGYNPTRDPQLQYLNPLSSSGASEYNPLAQQLQVVARLIQAGMSGATGVRRQVFFVSMGGFDTHSNQNQSHSVLMARLAHAMSYFDKALGAINARNAVTTFTASDFGRTFTSNGDGTDHGWGSHQWVMGGAVKGGDLYGAFPTLVAKNPTNDDFNSPDQVRNGAMLPTSSVDQLGATLGRWFGLSDDAALSVFPNLRNFNATQRNLGFMV